MYNPDIPRAIQFAQEAHGDQRRLYTGDTYTTHTVAVAVAVAVRGVDDDVIIAAHLHDVVEDTDRSIDDIRSAFGDRVARIVTILSDPPVVKGINRKARKAATRMRYLMAQGQDSIDANTIKFADCYDNALSIKVYDSDFWKVYRSEVSDLVKVMVLGDEFLKRRLIDIISNEEGDIHKTHGS